MRLWTRYSHSILFLFQAFTTLVNNALQIAVINGVGDFILFLGKCFVTAATASVGLLFMREDPKLHFYAAPIFVVCVFAFFIANCVISLYEVSSINDIVFCLFFFSLQHNYFSFIFQTVIDTLFLCICEDKNLNGDNGKWRQSALANVGDNNTNSNGQQSHELSPINQ